MGVRPQVTEGAVGGSAASGSEASDFDLSQRAARGDRAAAQKLIERHQAPVRAFLRKLTHRHDLAEDLAQETFVRLLRHADRYDPRFAMRTWLLTIARRLFINHLRSAQHRVTHTDAFDHHASREPGPDERVATADGREHLARQLALAMTSLNEPQRAAVLLFHQQGLSVQEVAQAMDAPVNTVKSHLHRARAVMRAVLEKNSTPMPATGGAPGANKKAEP